VIRRDIMNLLDKKHILCMFILIILSLHTPLSYINTKKYTSFRKTPLKEEMLMISSGTQQLPSGYSLKRPLFILKPALKHLDFFINTILSIACFICMLFIRAVINKRKLIHEFCVVKLHGSKYKSFLPSF
jgi:hypothetical protein